MTYASRLEDSAAALGALFAVVVLGLAPVHHIAWAEEGAGDAALDAAAGPDIQPGVAEAVTTLGPEELLPGVSGADFIGPEWERGTKVPARFASFASAELVFDSNVYLTGDDTRLDSAGESLADRTDIRTNVLAGLMYTARPGDGQQEYSLAGQLKLEAYAENTDLVDVEAIVNGTALFKFVRWDFRLDDSFRRLTQPTDINDSPAARILNTGTATLRIRLFKLDVDLAGIHQLREEQESSSSVLDYEAQTLRARFHYKIRSDLRVGVGAEQTQLTYKTNVSPISGNPIYPEGLDTTRVYVSLTGPLPGTRKLSFDAAVGMASVEAIEPDPSPTAKFDADGDTPFMNANLTWRSATQRTSLALGLRSDVFPSPRTLDIFETQRRVTLQAGHRFSRLVSADLTVRYETGDRATEGSPDQERVVLGVGVVYRLKRRSQIYLRGENTTYTTDEPNRDYDRLLLSFGVNLVF